jgi:hypothetical protein
LPYHVLLILGAYSIALVIAAGAVVAWLSGDDESENDNGSNVHTQGAGSRGTASQQHLRNPPASRESVKEAKKKITTLLASDECDRINELNPVSRQQFLDTKDRCESLKRLDGLKVRGAEAYGYAVRTGDSAAARGAGIKFARASTRTRSPSSSRLTPRRRPSASAGMRHTASTA